MTELEAHIKEMQTVKLAIHHNNEIVKIAKDKLEEFTRISFDLRNRYRELEMQFFDKL